MSSEVKQIPARIQKILPHNSMTEPLYILSSSLTPSRKRPWHAGFKQHSQEHSITDRCAFGVLVSMALWQSCHALPAMKTLQEAKGATWKPHHSIWIPFDSRDHTRPQHFPLIMNQFSANRPMWGISLYMKIPWFDKSASYAQNIKLNQNKDFNLPRLTQT